MTILREQIKTLGVVAANSKGALGVAQTGSLLHIDTGDWTCDITPLGHAVNFHFKHTNQGQLC